MRAYSPSLLDFSVKDARERRESVPEWTQQRAISEFFGSLVIESNSNQLPYQRDCRPGDPVYVLYLTGDYFYHCIQIGRVNDRNDIVGAR